MDAGHGAGKPISKTIAEVADLYGFSGACSEPVAERNEPESEQGDRLAGSGVVTGGGVMPGAVGARRVDRLAVTGIRAGGISVSVGEASPQLRGGALAR